MNNYNLGDVTNLNQLKAAAIEYAMNLPDFKINAKKAAVLLNVSIRTLESWRSDGIGPKAYRSGKNGRTVHYSVPELILYIVGGRGEHS